MVDYEVVKGDQETYTITIKVDGVAQDLNGYKFYFTVKSSIDDADVDAIIQVTETISTSVTSATITLESADTSVAVSSSTVNYIYDIRMIDASGDPRVLVSGKFKVKDPVTKSTS